MPKAIYQGEPGTEEKLKEFTIEVEWRERGSYTVRAKSLEDAQQMVYNDDRQFNTGSARGEYIDDSFEVINDDCRFERYCDLDELPSAETDAEVDARIKKEYPEDDIDEDG